MEKSHINPIFKMGNLEYLGTYGKHEAHSEENDEHDRAPNKIVQGTVDIGYNLNKSIHKFS